ncbi:DUF6336 family protein [Streptomyces sp. NPDC002623]
MPEPQAREPQAREPQAREPQAREPQAREPQAREPQAREPQAREPQAREPQGRDLVVREPRLSLTGIVLRGLAFGLATAPLLLLTTLTIEDHEPRREFLGLTGGLAASGALVCLLAGASFWSLLEGDIRRLRDWRTITGQADSYAVAIPLIIRAGAFALTLSPAAFTLLALVGDAAPGTWLHSR